MSEAVLKAVLLIAAAVLVLVWVLLSDEGEETDARGQC